MSEHRLIAEVRRFLPRDAIFVVDGNRILETAQQRMPSHVPVSRLTPGKNGCMGVGVPFGIGAKLAHPDRTVVVVTGDFAFCLNAMEMETAVRLRVPILVVVSNNDGNGGGRSERKYFPATPTASRSSSRGFATRRSCAPSAGTAHSSRIPTT